MKSKFRALLAEAKPPFPPTIHVLHKQIECDLSRLLDASAEAANNIQRGETAWLRVNLRSCLTLAQRIERHARAARRALATAERGARR